jgi:hypothetical protein
MPTTKYFAVLLLFLFQNLFSQSVLKGKVISEVNPDGIMVVNFTTKVSTITSDGGFFSILASSGDVLIITSKNIEGVQLRLDANSFNREILNIVVKAKTNELAEVQIKSISAKSLGVVPNNVKEYTPAERKLRTAEQFKWYSPLLIPFGGMSVDGLINQISGRTNQLKKELSVEKKELLLSRLDEMYEEQFYVETLQIPQEYIKGFQIFALDDAKFVEAVKSKNRTLVTFLMGNIANEYKMLISTEKR